MLSWPHVKIDEERGQLKLKYRTVREEQALLIGWTHFTCTSIHPSRSSDGGRTLGESYEATVIHFLYRTGQSV